MSYSSYAQNPTYELYVTNQSQVDSKTYQFDVYLLRTGTTDLVLYGVQFGLGIDTSITNGGSLSCFYVGGSTQLSSTQAAFTNQFVTTYFNVGGVVYRYFNQSAVAASTTSAATTISGVKNGCSSPGTRIGTYRLTNSVNFKPASTCKHFFSGLTAASGRTATKVSAWVNGVVVDISAGTTNGASNINYAYNTTGTCDQNLSLNGCAVLASVSSQTAVTCFGGSNGSATITLSGNGTSSTGTYTVDGGSSVSYTSNPFTVSGLSAGSHSISVSSGTCSASTGSFTIDGPSAAITSSFSASGCVSYTLPWGGSVTSSGAYNHTYTSAAGCDSTVTANVTIIPQPSQPNVACYQTATFNTSTCQWDVTGSQPQQPTIACYQTATFNNTTCEWDVTGSPIVSSFSDAGCGSYALPWGTTVSTSGSYDHVYTSALGCDSTVTANITINEATSSVTNYAACGSTLPYYWNGVAYNVAGSYTATLTNAAGCDSTAVLNLTISGVTPAAPTVVTQTLVSNNCGERIYRYAVTAVTGAAGYAWILPTSIGGVASGATIDSGDIASSRVIRVMYSSNAAAGSDSIKVRAYSGCGSSANKAFKLSNTAWAPLAAPAITATNLITNVCGERRIRYSVPVAATTAGLVGYEWSFVGDVLGANAFIDSGASDSRVIVVLYSSNAAAVANDSVKFRFNYNDGCTYGAYAKSKISLTALTAPLAPTITATTVISNVCGQRRIRYSVPTTPAATATAGAATGYEWSIVGTGLSASAVIDSGASDSRVIVVLYPSNEAAAASDSVRCRYNSDCGFGAYGKSKNALAALTVPAAPIITATTVISNVCGQRRIRYSVPVTPAATTTAGAASGYEWSIVGTGLSASAFIDSGASDSRVIVVLYPSNAAAAVSDSVRCRYTSDCGFSAYAKSKNALAALGAPIAPTAITATTVVSNVCGGRKVRYSVPVTPAATATAGAATGYEWSFVGTGLSASAFIDSGASDSRVIVVLYPSNAAAVASDSVKCRYTSDCGFGAYKAFKNPLAALTAPLAPTAITITAVAPSVCGAKVYRYAAPATLPVATATAGAATGWLWSFTGTLGANASIDSGNVNSQVILVSFTSNALAGTGDSVRLAYLSAGCGTSANKSSKLTNVVTAVPAAPTAITATALQTNVCGARRYRYAAPAAVPVATATLAAPTGWFWSFTGTLGANAVIDSGNVNSKVITVTFTSNAAAATGDSVKLQYTSSCGNSLPAKLKLTNTALVTPAPATAPTIQVVSDICGDRRYRYTAPALVGSTATAPAATGWLWSFTGTLGANAVIDSGDATSQKIVVRFTVYTAAATGDSVRVAFTSGCGTSANKSTKLSNLAKTCTTPANIPVTKAPVVNIPAEAMSVKVFPNPSTTNFNVQVITAGKEEITVRVLDVQGRFIKSVKVAAGKTMNIGSELKPGAYFIEVRQGREVKTTRVLKF